MLSNELMGVLALAVVWVTTLLVVGAMAQRITAIAGLRRRMRPLAPGEVGVGLVEGEVGPGHGDANDGSGNGKAASADDAFTIAVHRIEQVGRQAADDHDRRAIVFSDRSYAGEMLGGTLKRDGGGDLRLAKAESADVW